MVARWNGEISYSILQLNEKIMAHKRILEIVQYRHDRCEKNKSHCTLGKIICGFNLFIFTGSENMLLYAYIYYISKLSSIIGILFWKLFWSGVRKKLCWDWEKRLWTLKQFIRAVKGHNNFWNGILFLLVAGVSLVEPLTY